METSLKRFINANGLKQVEVARYLSVGESFMSQLVKGTRPLPKNLLKLLLENKEGWDVSMLAGDQRNISIGRDASGVIVNGDNVHSPIDNRQYYSDSPDVLRATIDLLDERIKEKDAQIKEKDAQIKQLLDILAKR